MPQEIAATCPVNGDFVMVPARSSFSQAMRSATHAPLMAAGVDSMVKFRKQFEDEGNNWDDWLAANAARTPRDPLSFRLQQVLHLFWHNLDKRGLAKGTT